MAWFLLSLVAPFLYAVTNYLDKILLEKYFKNNGTGTIVIISGLLSVLALPFLYAADPSVLSVDPFHIAVLAFVGILNALILFFYLKALEDEEASTTIIFYQLVPVFAYGLGYLILGETLSLRQVVAMAIVILGASIMAFEIDIESKFRFRKRTVWFMLLASLCWAAGGVVFKAVALQEDVVRSLFWEHLMLALIGIGILVSVRSYRVSFLSAMRHNRAGILAVSFLTEIIYMAANIIFAFAYLLAPIALVLLSDSYQPLFALIIGLVITRFWPRLLEEKLHMAHLWQKGLAIVITGAGTYLLLFA